MPRETLLPPVVAGPSACTLLPLYRDLYDPVKPAEPAARVSVGGAAPVAFDTDVTDDFADLAWLDGEGEELGGGDEAQAELSRLESVFGSGRTRWEDGPSCGTSSDDGDDELLLLDGDLQGACTRLRV